MSNTLTRGCRTCYNRFALTWGEFALVLFWTIIEVLSIAVSVLHVLLLLVGGMFRVLGMVAGGGRRYHD